MACTFFSVTSLAFAQVLIVNGSDGTSEPGTTAQITTNLSNLHTAVGNTVTVSSTIPVNLGGYSQVWDIRFSNNFALTAPQQTQYLGFLQGGGGMFLMGENSGFMARNNSVLDLIALAGGGTIGFTTPSSNQTVNAPFTGPNAVTQVTYAAPGGFTNSGTGTFITQVGSIGSGIAFGVGTLADAPLGALTSIFDVNFMQNFYDLPHSQNLTKNLIGFVQDQVEDPVNPPDLTPIPEPSAFGLVAVAGLFMLLLVRRPERRA
jgi:hypothetical protein